MARAMLVCFDCLGAILIRTSAFRNIIFWVVRTIVNTIVVAIIATIFINKMRYCRKFIRRLGNFRTIFINDFLLNINTALNRVCRRQCINFIDIRNAGNIAFGVARKGNALYLTINQHRMMLISCQFKMIIDVFFAENVVMPLLKNRITLIVISKDFASIIGGIVWITNHYPRRNINRACRPLSVGTFC